jgi:hypothetical protein
MAAWLLAMTCDLQGADTTPTAAAEPNATAEVEKLAEGETKLPAGETVPPKLRPEQVSYEYVLGVLRTLTEGSERRYAAMEEQIDRLKAQIDALNRSTESLAAKKETAKAPPVELEVPPAVPPAKGNGKDAAATPVIANREPAAKLPAWVGMGLQRVGNDFRVAATIGPYSRPAELEAEWPVAMQDAVDCYARRQFGPRAIGQIRLSEVELRGLIREEWPITEEYGAAGKTKTLHVLLVFDPAMQARIRTQWESTVITQRLEYAATGVASSLLLLGILFACLKLDHTTAGACRIRLVLAGIFLTGALTAGTTAAVQLLRTPPAEAAAENAPARSVSVELTDAGGSEPAARQATVTASATSLLVWLGAGVGLLGVLLLFSVGKKPAIHPALKETAMHEVH